MNLLAITYIEPMLDYVRRTPEEEDAASHDEREEERGRESPYNKTIIRGRCASEYAKAVLLVKVHSSGPRAHS